VLREIEALPKSDSLIVASHFAFYASALLPKLSRMNHVVHFHGPWAAETAVEGQHQSKVALKRMIERSVYSSAKAFVTLSRAFKDLLVDSYGVDPRRIHVIPGGVDLKQFTPGDRGEARERLGLPKTSSVFLCVRRLVRRMGLELLIEAFAVTAQKHPNVFLMIGGSGPLRAELETKVRNYDLSNQIRFLGFIPDEDLALAYRAANLSIVPSQSLEGFGLTSLESLACGTPVLVTPVGGLPEAVAGLSPELVLSDRTAETLGRSLNQFLKGGLVVPSAADCRRYVEANFSWHEISERVKKVYWEVAH
jgi:glycosyltransferase involved in cell wall biosynthesis